MISRNQIKLIKSLEQKKYRKLHGLFVAEGVKIVNEILESTFEIDAIYALKDWIEQHSNIETTSLSPSELERISQLKQSNEVLAVAKIPEANFCGFNQKINLILDGIRDPGNLGTIIRLADWYGMSEIYCTLDCVDAFNPKVVQASMGSLFRIKVLYLAPKSFDELSTNSNPVFGAFADHTDVHALMIKEGCSLIIGNESNGIRPAMEKLITQKISIRRYGKAESLNAAIACGILLDNLTLRLK